MIAEYFAIVCLLLLTFLWIKIHKRLEKRVHQLELDGLTLRQKDLLIKLECEENNEYTGG